MKEKSLKIHEGGKLKIAPMVAMNDAKDLALAYTPGVAFPCLEIKEHPDDVYRYTSKGHMVAIVTDGSAVLGLGDIGPHAAIPVMEGKALLLKRFADVDGFPICLDTKDPDKIIETVKLISPMFGGIILEDISAPRCVTIERRLKKELNIPVFHDDQHGTAIVVGAALTNASRLLHKPLSSMRMVISGTGAAGSSIMRIAKGLGVGIINAYNIRGVVDHNKINEYDFVVHELLEEGIIDTPIKHDGTLASIMKGANIFVGVSAPNIVTVEMVQSMAKDAIVFAMANPTPEIMPNLAKEAGARIVGTGRSDFPNQVNNVLAFPGIFKGALLARATQITEEMKLTASLAIASLISEEELRDDYVIPSAFDPRVVEVVSQAIIDHVQKH
ncbi:MAG: NAD-dependent malic enzyme [Bacilli bacterium]|nr:NAD-dependent malic enzyme [Bacilli bacterium]